MTVRHAPDGAKPPLSAINPRNQRAGAHKALPHELRRAHAVAKTLAEALEVAGMDEDAAAVRAIRQRCWQALIDAEAAR